MSDPAAGLLRVGTGRGRWVIAATVLGSAMASIDATVVGIALPTIGRQFHASLGTLQWVVTGYSLTLASLLLLGGSLGDNFGRRRVFMVGVIWFVLASAACALAPGTTVLIGTRVLQGVGAALLTPGSLAILQASFDPDDRGQAIGSWSGLGGVATAAGPLLGGYLIAAASWRLIFLVNLPIGAFVLLISARHVPESRTPGATGHVDIAGALLATLALGGATFALIEGPSLGWAAPPVLAMLSLAIVSGFAFFLVEKFSAGPMLPLAVFRVRQFTITNAVTFIIYAALGGALFLLPLQLQVVDHYSPLESGAALLPLTVVLLLLSARSGRLATRIGPRLQMSVGPVVVGLGLALLGRIPTDPSYLWVVLPAVLVFGLGLAVTVAPLTATALGAVPAEHSGVASAVNNDVARVGSLIAVAVLPALAGISGTSYLHPAELSSGFRKAALVSGGLCAAAGLLAAAGIRNRPPASPDVEAGAGHPGPEACFHCALDASPVVVDPRVASRPD
ncbi:MAG: MFS transporter [Acidimicrobiales bacterium]|jgi:EmrB/QacA subfamily drug resistance transporter